MDAILSKQWGDNGSYHIYCLQQPLSIHSPNILKQPWFQDNILGKKKIRIWKKSSTECWGPSSLNSTGPEAAETWLFELILWGARELSTLHIYLTEHAYMIRQKLGTHFFPWNTVMKSNWTLIKRWFDI